LYINKGVEVAIANIYGATTGVSAIPIPATTIPTPKMMARDFQFLLK